MVSPKKAPFVTLGLFALWCLFIETNANMFGGAVGVDFGIMGPFHVGLVSTVEGFRAARALGDVTLFAASGDFSLGLRTTLLSSLQTGVEAAIRVGFGLLSGAPMDETVEGHRVQGSFGGPLLRLFAAWGKIWPSIGLGLEGGYAAWGNSGRVTDGRSVEMKSFWVSVLFGVRFWFFSRVGT